MKPALGLDLFRGAELQAFVGHRASVQEFRKYPLGFTKRAMQPPAAPE